MIYPSNHDAELANGDDDSDNRSDEEIEDEGFRFPATQAERQAAWDNRGMI